MVLNPGKCHDMLLGNGEQPDNINLSGTETTSSNNNKSVSLRIDKKESFDAHTQFLRKEERTKNFSRTSKYLPFDQKSLLRPVRTGRLGSGGCIPPKTLLKFAYYKLKMILKR